MKVTYGQAVIEGWVPNNSHRIALATIVEALDETVWGDGSYTTQNIDMTKVRITIDILEDR